MKFLNYNFSFTKYNYNFDLIFFAEKHKIEQYSCTLKKEKTFKMVKSKKKL